MKKEEIVSLIGMWLICLVTVILYVKYHRNLKTLGEVVVFSAPVMFFGLVGIYIVNRDRKVIRRSRKKREEELGKTIELNWGQALKHDLLVYLTPISIMVIPFFFEQTPGLNNVFAAIIAYLVLIYLKFMYWREL